MNGKKLNVYKVDSWNQMNIHVHGRRYVVSEISSTEGETTYDFLSRQEMLRWAEERFTSDRYGEEESRRIMERFKKA
jgi:hypothetical protein